jgi:hypothetical protein
MELGWLVFSFCFGVARSNLDRMFVNRFQKTTGGEESLHHFIQTALSRIQSTGNRSFIAEYERRRAIGINHRGQGWPRENACVKKALYPF